ncbi:MAG: glycogen synthase GlgA [Saccharofermentanales bacterium]
MSVENNGTSASAKTRNSRTDHRRPSVLFVSAEVSPFAKVGGLADVVGALPGVLAREGCDARVIMPFYRKVKEKYKDKARFLQWSMIKLGWRSQYCGLYSYVHSGVTYYFIDNEYFFGHDKIYIEYTFDIERFCFFQRAVLSVLGIPIGFIPDIIHCNDWQAGMIPCLLKAHYQSSGYFKDVKTIFTIHNIKYQGIHSKEMIEDLMDLPLGYMNAEGVLFNGSANFLKAGIVYSDAVTTVSPSYAQEILTHEYGEGLDGILWKYADKLSGILNGIDYSEFSPDTDELLPSVYTKDTFKEGKKVCKRSLQKELGLKAASGTLLAAMITRLVDQKGLDLFLDGFREIIGIPVQIVILGTGDPYYEKTLTDIAAEYPGQFSVSVTFDNSLAHRIYAGADVFLMPSLFEPCGLSQIISMRYGTIPIVRETGGLKDTVMPYNEYTGEGTGFSFHNANSGELVSMIRYASEIYKKRKDAWDWLIRNGMSMDFSWTESARRYIGIYLDAMKR